MIASIQIMNRNAPNINQLKDSEPENPAVVVDADFPPAEIKNAPHRDGEKSETDPDIVPDATRRRWNQQGEATNLEQIHIERRRRSS